MNKEKQLAVRALIVAVTLFVALVLWIRPGDDELFLAAEWKWISVGAFCCWISGGIWIFQIRQSAKDIVPVLRTFEFSAFIVTVVLVSGQVDSDLPLVLWILGMFSICLAVSRVLALFLSAHSELSKPSRKRLVLFSATGFVMIAASIWLDMNVNAWSNGAQVLMGESRWVAAEHGLSSTAALTELEALIDWGGRITYSLSIALTALLPLGAMILWRWPHRVSSWPVQLCRGLFGFVAMYANADLAFAWMGYSAGYSAPASWLWFLFVCFCLSAVGLPVATALVLILKGTEAGNIILDLAFAIHLPIACTNFLLVVPTFSLLVLGYMVYNVGSILLMVGIFTLTIPMARRLDPEHGSVGREHEVASHKDTAPLFL